VFILGSGCG